MSPPRDGYEYISLHSREPRWGRRITNKQTAHLGVTEDFVGNATSELLGPEQNTEWVAHPAFAALFVASHRGHVESAKFLLRHGAGLQGKALLQGPSFGSRRCHWTEPLLGAGSEDRPRRAQRLRLHQGLSQRSMGPLRSATRRLGGQALQQASVLRPEIDGLAPSHPSSLSSGELPP
ncbi:ankyrin repeat domain-containing protein 60 isoform 1-T1 [Alca torda]